MIGKISTIVNFLSILICIRSLVIGEKTCNHKIKDICEQITVFSAIMFMVSLIILWMIGIGVQL